MVIVDLMYYDLGTILYAIADVTTRMIAPNQVRVFPRVVLEFPSNPSFPLFVRYIPVPTIMMDIKIMIWALVTVMAIFFVLFIYIPLHSLSPLEFPQ